MIGEGMRLTKADYIALIEGATTVLEINGILNAATTDMDLTNEDIKAVHQEADYRTIDIFS